MSQASPRRCRLLFACLATALAVCLALSRPTNAAQIRLALSLPLSAADDGPRARAVAEYLRISVTDVNRDIAGPAGHNVTLTPLDSAGSISRSAQNAFTATQSNGTNAIGLIGEWSSTLTPNMALIAQQLGMYTCTGAATTTLLSDDADFPMTFRTIPSDEQQGNMLARYIRAMGWSSCAVLSSNSEYGRSITVAFQRTANELGIMVASSETLQFSNPNAATDGGFMRSLRATAEAGVRVVMFFGSAAEYLAISPLAKQAGMIGEEWAWIASESVAGITDIVSSNSQYRQLTQGLQYIFPLEVADQRVAQSLLSRAQPALGSVSRLEPYAGFFRDCLYALTVMYVEMLKSGVPESAVLSRTANIPMARALKPFQGISGRVTFSADGERQSAYQIFNVFDGKSTPVYDMDAQGNVKELVAPKFFDGSTKRPQDHPDSIIAFVRFSRFGAWLVIAVTGAIVIATIGATVMVLKHYQSRIVREHMPVVVVLLSTGIVLISASSLAWIDVQTAMTCNAALWGMGVGVSLIVIPLMYRTFWTWKSFENSILRRSTSTSATSTLPFIGLFAVQIVILLCWTFFAPLRPAPLATATSFSYQCRSANATLNDLFKYTLAVWSLGMLSGLLYLTSSTRFLKSPGLSTRYAHFVATNLLLCSAVTGPLSVIKVPSFSLGNYWIHVALVWYLTLFTLGMTHVRILQLVRKPQDDKDDLFGHHIAGAPGAKPTTTLGNGHGGAGQASMSSGTSSIAINKDFVAMPGKQRSLVGDFAVKFPGLLATWQVHSVLVALDEGFFGVTRFSSDQATAGQVWAIKHVLVAKAIDLDMVVEVHVDGKPAMWIQMRSDEQVAQFVQLLSGQGPSRSPSVHRRR